MTCGLWACEGARVPLLGGAGSWGIAGKDLLSWEFADLHSPPRPSRQPLLFLAAAPGAALREASPSPGGVLRPKQGHQGKGKPCGQGCCLHSALGNRKPGSASWHGPPLPLPRGCTELSARRPPCLYPRLSSRADAVKVSPSLLLQPRGDKSQGCGDGKEGAKLYL